jgi:hypothetical protein
MKKFLAVFTGNPGAMEKWKELPEASRKEKEMKGIAAWKSWASSNEKRTAYMGGPLGKTKRVESKGIQDIRNNMSAFTIVEAETHEEAAKLFVNHPHFSIFPGDGVEIMEIMAIPGM